MKIPVAGQLSALPELPAVRVSIEAGERPGQELAQVAAEGEQLARQWQVVERQLELARETANTSKFLMEMDEEMQGRLERPDTTVSPAEASAAFRKEFAQKAEQFVAPMPNAVIRSRMLTQLNHHINTRANEYRARAVEVHREQLVGDFLQAGEKAGQEYARTGDPEKLAVHLVSLRDLVNTGVIHPDKAVEYQQKFLSQAETNRVDADASVSPWETMKRLSDRSQYPHLTESERLKAITRVHERITMADEDVKKERADRADAFKRDLARDFASTTKYRLPDGSIDESQVWALVPADLDSHSIDHIRSLIAAANSRAERMSKTQANTVASGVRTRMYEGESKKDWASVERAMREAELSLVQHPEQLEPVTKLYRDILRHKDTMDERALEKMKKEDADKLRAYEALEGTAIAQFLSWFPVPSPTEAKFEGVREAYTQGKEQGLAIIRSAARQFKNPITAIEGARQEILMHVLGGPKSAAKRRQEELASYGIYSKADLVKLKGTLPTLEYERMMELFTDWYELDQKARRIGAGVSADKRPKE